VLSLLTDNGDADFRNDPGIKPDLHAKFSNIFQRLLQEDLFPIDMKAFFLKSLLNILAGYSPEKFILFSHFTRNDTSHILKFLEQLLRLLSFLLRQLRNLYFFVFKRIHILDVGFYRKPFGDEIVPGVTVRHFNDIPQFSQGMISPNFPRVSTSSFRMTFIIKPPSFLQATCFDRIGYLGIQFSEVHPNICNPYCNDNQQQKILNKY